MNPTPSGTWRRPRRLANNTSINNADTIDSLKRMADNVWREMEAFHDEIQVMHSPSRLSQRVAKLAEHVAGLVHRIKTELV